MLSARFFLVFGSKLPLFADNGKFSTIKMFFADNGKIWAM